MELTVKEVTGVLKGQLILGDPMAKLTRASCDSRQVKKGDLFFSLEGQHRDGHDFAAVACGEGAGGVVVSHLNWMSHIPNLTSAVIRVQEPMKALQSLASRLRNGFHGPVVGITGSNGKTTTKQMIKEILSSLGPGLATRGNFNSQVGLPLILSELSKDHKWMALEMGASEPGHITQLANMARPLLGVLTSIGPAHLATFGSMDKLVETKWELMDSLPGDGCAVLPWGIPDLDAHIRAFKKKIIFFGENTSCPVRASAIEVGRNIKFRLHIGSQSSTVKLPVTGRINVSNALASAAAAWALDCSLEDIVAGLERFKPLEMRMEWIDHPSGAVIINDAYNANPSSLLEAMRSFAETFPTHKRVLVMGSMLELGTESDKWHFHVGSELGRFHLEQVFLIGEETQNVLSGAQSVGARKNSFQIFSNTEDLAESLKPYLKSGTAVLLKGSRGTGLENILGGLKKEPVA